MVDLPVAWQLWLLVVSRAVRRGGASTSTLQAITRARRCAFSAGQFNRGLLYLRFSNVQACLPLGPLRDLELEFLIFSQRLDPSILIAEKCLNKSSRRAWA
jgi:hypothetical protein